MKPYFLLIYFILSFSVFSQGENSWGHQLWYEQPGKDSINEGLPIGNGRLGALVCGQIKSERIPICEDSVWSGWTNPNANNPRAFEVLPEIREKMFKGQNIDAERLVRETQICQDKTVEGEPMWDAYGTYQMLAFLDLVFDVSASEVTNYRRELDLRTGIVSVHYSVGDLDYVREFYSSYVDQVVVVRMACNEPGQLNFSARLKRPDSNVSVEQMDEDVFRLVGAMKAPDGIDPLCYELVLKAETKGAKPELSDSGFTWVGADEVVLYLSASTNYKGMDAYPNYVGSNMRYDTLAQVASASEKGERNIRSDHVEDFGDLYSRNTLELGRGNKVPTDERLKNVVNGGNSDVILDQLLFNYARYLLISSSRGESLPANLQGLWTCAQQNKDTGYFEYWSPWNGDYHTNINVQMNYWPALSGNLEECVFPLHKMLQGLAAPGKEMAGIQHGCDGWTVHTIHNIWGHAAPGSEASWGHFPLAGPWLMRHVWDHFLYTRDIAHLEANWELLKGSAAFVCDWFIPHPDTGEYVSVPAASPENKFRYKNGELGYFCIAPTMDQMIAKELLSNVVAAADILGKSGESGVNEFRKVKDQLRTYKIASDGRMMEWSEEYEEVEKGHRHISHLYDLYPGDGIYLQSDDTFARAAAKTLNYRIQNGGGHTGWSSAWIVNFRARLGQGEQAYEQLLKLQRKSTLPNLFNSHPPFQIDGNFGVAAGMIEMIVQSFYDVEKEETTLQLLPALSNAWGSGSLHGVKLKGALLADIEWQNGEVRKLELMAEYPTRVCFNYAGKSYETQLRSGETVKWDF